MFIDDTSINIENAKKNGTTMIGRAAFAGVLFMFYCAGLS